MGYDRVMPSDVQSIVSNERVWDEYAPEEPTLEMRKLFAASSGTCQANHTACERLVDPAQMGERYRVLAVVDEGEGVPAGFAAEDRVVAPPPDGV